MRGGAGEEARSLGEVAYDRFMEALYSRRLKPGAFLSQHDLVEMLGVPVGPLRDALRVLQTEGLVTIRARSGIEVVKPDLAMAKNTYQIRGILEEAAVRVYAETAPIATITAMEARHEALIDSFGGKEPTAGDIREMEALDRDFHFEVIASLRNPMVDDTHRRIHAILNLILLERPFSAPVMARTLREHLRILTACKARDADAAQKALADHFSEALKRAMALF